MALDQVRPAGRQPGPRVLSPGKIPAMALALTQVAPHYAHLDGTIRAQPT